MQLAILRYTQKTLPPYRYIPSQHPHPVIDPKGHSYQKAEEKLKYCSPEAWVHNESYLYGVDLFNHGYWWEAHEAWENVWLTTAKHDLEGQYLQSLIQFSAALLKLYSGSKRGFDNLYREAEKRMRFCLAELSVQHRRIFMGLHLEHWMEKMETFKNSLPGEEGQTTDALHFASFPALILETKASNKDT